MPAPGWVKTARGHDLNLDELIARSRAPIKKNIDEKNKIVKRPLPRPPVNVRGYVPQRGTAPVRVKTNTVEVVENKQTPSSFTGGSAASMADLTGVKVDQAKYHKNKAKAKDLEATTGAALQEVLGELGAITKDTSGPENVP